MRAAAILAPATVDECLEPVEQAPQAEPEELLWRRGKGIVVEGDAPPQGQDAHHASRAMPVRTAQRQPTDRSARVALEVLRG